MAIALQNEVINMQSYGGRDAAIGQYYEMQLKKGAVEENFQFYGCTYLENGEIGFYITEKEHKFFSFLFACEQNNIYCTPPYLQTFWAKIAQGERQLLKRRFQFEMLEEMQDRYSPEFFMLIGELLAIEAVDDADLIFSKWKQELDSSYDEDALLLFEATVSMALQMKVLTKYTAEKYLIWLDNLKQQMQEDKVQEQGECHLYAGFAAFNIKNNTIRYQKYSKRNTAWEKRAQTLNKDTIVTPILVKENFFDGINFMIVQKKNAEFEECLKKNFDTRYFEYLKQIYTLPMIISEKQKTNLEKQYFALETEKEKSAFLQYAAQLRIFFD